MSGKRFSGSNSKKNGFYLALAVCLVAVGVAAWSTYEAVQEYLEPNPSTSDVSKSAEQEDGENLIQRATPVPATSVPTEEADAQPSEPEENEAENPPAENADTPAVEEETEEAAVNEPLYEISEIMTSPVSSEEILKTYSKGTPVFSPTMKDWRIHTGTDFAAESGGIVTACANGMVQDVYTDPFLGNIVEIEHGDYVFYYCGVGEDFEVTAGEVVSAGQEIGKVTAVPSESADLTHLHLEVKRDGAYMDPAEVLAQFKAPEN